MTGRKLVPLDHFTKHGRIEIIRGDAIIPRSYDWIWPGWLCRGKLHLIAGRAGTGKTTLALALGAIVTVGDKFPDGAAATLGDILIWSGEDDADDSLMPRFHASGGNPSRLHYVKGRRDDKGKTLPFDPSIDMAELADAARDIPNLQILILDPVVSAISGDSNKTGDVRRDLQPVVDLAACLGAAVLGVTHFTKGSAGRDPLERVTGSHAFGAVARLVMATAKGAEASDPRRLVRVKSNIGLDGDGFEYDLVQVPLDKYPGVYGQRINWGEPLVGTAAELLAEVEGPERDKASPECERAAEWLEERLGAAPVPAKQVQQDALMAGLSWKTVNRAKRSLGIKPRKTGMGGGWVWSLPSAEGGREGAEGGHADDVTTFGGNDHLRPDAPDREEF